MDNIKAKIQLMDNYVKEYQLQVYEKISENSDIKEKCSLGFAIIKIREQKEKNIIGQIQMAYDIKLYIEEREVGKINLTLEAIFEGDKDITKDKFEELLRINGTMTLSQIARTYIMTNTALSGMPVINTPMINFVEFFQRAN